MRFKQARIESWRDQMLRSMIIGLAIASLLQIGAQSIAPAQAMALSARRIDWASMQSAAVDRLLCQGYRLLSGAGFC